VKAIERKASSVSAEGKHKRGKEGDRLRNVVWEDIRADHLGRKGQNEGTRPGANMSKLKSEKRDFRSSIDIEPSLIEGSDET